MIDLIATILSIIVGVVSWYTSEERKITKTNADINKALAEGDSQKLSVSLSGLFDRVRSKGSGNSR